MGLLDKNFVCYKLHSVIIQETALLPFASMPMQSCTLPDMSAAKQ